MTYIRRIIDDKLDQLVPQLAAIAIEGAKGVGKTATAQQRAASVFDMTVSQQRLVLEADTSLLATAQPPVLVDEWQLVPATWDQVKRCVDDDPSGGRFLLTGSATPGPGVRIHSGAGRIVSFLLRPLSLPERGIATPSVSLRDQLTGGTPAISGQSSVRLPEYAEEIVASGFPGIRQLPRQARRLQLDSYLRRVVDRDLADNGVVVRQPTALTQWLTAYAAATATTASYSTILDAATPGEGDKPARQSVSVYREALERQFLLEPLPAWLPAMSPLRRLAQAPKHHLVDPALAARLLSVDVDSLLKGEGQTIQVKDGPLLGALFESLAVQTVRVLAQANDATVWHLRTKGGEHEVDIIVQGDDGRVVAYEVKLNPAVSDKETVHLRWLRDQWPQKVADVAVITTGEWAYRRADGVAMVPLALLGV